MDSFDLTVIGAGPGGYTAAIRAAQKGLRTAIIESRDVGGTCLNRGCIPTKTLLHSAHMYRQMKDGGLFGLTGCDGVGFDFEKMNGRKNDIVLKMRAGTERLLKSAGVKVIRGKATIQDAHTVTVEAAELRTEHIIIATGSKPNRLPASMQSIGGVITSDEALAEHAKLYRRILIVGGGVIGVEFAGIYNDLGCEVTVIDTLDRLLSRMDTEISGNLAKLFAKRGVKVMTRSLLQSIEETERGLVCKIARQTAKASEDGSAPQLTETEADCVLVCVGRSPVTDCAASFPGIELDERGFIVTDEFTRTSVPNIYAIGDCAAGSPQLAHSASAQGLNAVSRVVGEKPAVNMKAVPACVYSNPEIAAVGLTATEAETLGMKVKTSKYLMNGNGKSIITNEDRGFVKLVFNAETDALVGAHLMCARATDIIGGLVAAVANGRTAQELAAVIRPHPTYVEGVTEAAESLFGLSIHTEKSALHKATRILPK